MAFTVSLAILWTTASVADGASPSQAPGGTIYFYRASDPQGLYAVAPNGGGLRALTCDGDRTHGGSPRRVLQVEAVGGTFLRMSYAGLIEEPVVRLVSTDESCGDVRVLWSPGAGHILRFPAWSIDGKRVALAVARYDALGQMVDQGIWVGDVDPAGDGLRALHLSVPLALTPVAPDPRAEVPDGMVLYADVTPVIHWAPDARRVVYDGAADPTSPGNPPVILVADLGPVGSTAQGVQRRVAVSGSAGQIYPAFSPVPGDERIAYVETTSMRGCMHNDIFTVPSAGGTPRQVTTSKNANVCQLMHPEWSPDGRWIAFSAAPQSLSGIGIWYIPADGSGKAVSVVTATGGVQYVAPRWRR